MTLLPILYILVLLADSPSHRGLLFAQVVNTNIVLGNPRFGNATYLSDILILNLPHRSERLASSGAALREQGLNFTRFPAVNGIAARNREWDKVSIHPGIKFNFRHWVEAGEHLPGDYGVTGCWLSHLTAYFEISDRVRERGLPDLPVMILEDDVYLEPNATQLITLGGESLPDDWEVFFVGFKNDYCLYTISPHLCRGSMLLDTHAYIVRNASVAEKLIFYSNQDSPQVADIYWIKLFKDILKIFLLRPREVIRQNHKFESDLHFPPPSPPPAFPSNLSLIHI